jgi:hypothetical protein
MDKRRQCTATSKQSGQRCKRAPIPGGTVCVMHGGATPAVKAAAEQRLAEKAANTEIDRLWLGFENAQPVTDPVASLQRLAGALEEMTDTVGKKVAALKDIEAGEDLTRVRGLVVLLDKLLGHLRGTLEAMVRLGIAQQRLVQLERDQARMVGVAVEAGLEAVGLDAAQREVFVRAFMARLRTGDGEA